MSARAAACVAALRPSDAPAASDIEHVSMPRPWPRAELLRDVAENPGAVYLGAYSMAGCDGASQQRVLVGFVGAWQLVDVLHVTTIAVRPDWRQRGVGRSLMLRLVRCALALGMSSVTLEVRESNLAAQRLYAGLGFREVGRRPKYYADNGEDALLLTTPDARDPAWLGRLSGLERSALPECPGDPG